MEEEEEEEVVIPEEDVETIFMQGVLDCYNIASKLMPSKRIRDEDMSRYITTETRETVQARLASSGAEEEKWRHRPPKKQHEWAHDVIRQLEPNGNISATPFEYLMYYNSMGNMDARTFGVYIILSYGSFTDLFKLVPYRLRGPTHDRIANEYSCETASLHFSGKMLSKAQTTFTGSAIDIREHLTIDPSQSLAAVTSPYWIEITPHNGLSQTLKERYDFPPLQPSHGLVLLSEHLSQLPVKKSVDHYPCGWPARTDLCPNVMFDFENGMRMNTETKLYIQDMSVVHPLTYKPSPGSNIALQQGCMIASKIVPAGRTALRYDLITVFPSTLHYVFNVVKLVVNSSVREVKHRDANTLNMISLRVGPEGPGCTIMSAERSVELHTLLEARLHLHGCLAFVFENARPTKESECLSAGDFKRYQQMLNKTRTEKHVLLPSEMLHAVYEACWHQTIAWVS